MIVGRCIRAASRLVPSRTPVTPIICRAAYSSTSTSRAKPIKQAPKPIERLQDDHQEDSEEVDLGPFPDPFIPPTIPKAQPAHPGAAHGGNAQVSQLLAQVAQLQQEKAALLHERTTLQQENERFQAQLVYHSAVEAIYGETGFNQLRNIIADFSEEEVNLLKGLGFESESLVQQLESRQRDLVIQFSHTVETDLCKHINLYIKKLKEQHRQSSSAATATQQTLRNAGMPDSVVSAAVASMQPHLEELQAKLARWEKLKADVDLLLATHGNT